MNAVLPTGIEAYLKEAGFSATEMLVLRKLVEEDSLTIRELASKTGKSTGVLDQAMKKLISKRIAQRNMINDQPRYSIQSLDAVVRWVKDDMQTRKDNLERKHQNFESFIASLKVDRHRPDIEHFNGLDGIKQAYLKLIDSGQELLTFTPITNLTEDDPLRLFRVELFRKRQVRKIFQRVLAPDTPLARRFQSRDPFEYRKTQLLPEAELPMTFEKTIVGDTIACFNFTEETACFLKYPELAKAERAVFESLWVRAQNRENNHESLPAVQVPVIPLQTRILSAFREFILSKRSIAVLVAFALVAGVMTFGLYKYNRELNLQRIRDKVLAIAVTGALQFDSSDIQLIRTPSDIKRQEYAKLVATLNLIRRSNEDIQNAYIMRQTEDPWVWEFVADADSLDPTAKKDLNADEKFDEADQLISPGDKYSIRDFPWSIDAFKKPMADPKPITDQWGTFITSSAQIKDSAGNTVAILGVDMLASKVDELSSQTFSPLIVFIALFLVFFIIRFFALNRSLTKECLDYLGHRKLRTFLWLTFIILSLISLRYVFSSYTNHLIMREKGEKLRSIALSVVDEFDVEDLNKIHFARDMQTDEYQKIFKKLNEIRNRFPEITFAYLVRPTDDPNLFEFIVDADANYNLPLYTKYNIADRTPLGEADENVWPGVIYDDSLSGVFSASLKKSAFVEPILDQWGSAMTGCAPLFKAEIPVAILCLDINYD